MLCNFQAFGPWPIPQTQLSRQMTFNSHPPLPPSTIALLRTRNHMFACLVPNHHLNGVVLEQGLIQRPPKRIQHRIEDRLPYNYIPRNINCRRDIPVDIRLLYTTEIRQQSKPAPLFSLQKINIITGQKLLTGTQILRTQQRAPHALVVERLGISLGAERCEAEGDGDVGDGLDVARCNDGDGDGAAAGDGAGDGDAGDDGRGKGAEQGGEEGAGTHAEWWCDLGFEVESRWRGKAVDFV